MIHWPRYVGAWRSKTTRLTLEQKGVYGELLDEAYASEQPLPLDIDSLCRIACAFSKTEREAVRHVVTTYFERTPQGYVHQRVIEEVERFREISGKRQTAARARWDKAPKPKRERANGQHAPVELPDWLDADKWAAWMKIRPAKARTEDAQRAALKKLEKFREQGHDPKAIVETSLANGWQGLFAPDARQATNLKGTAW